MNKEMTPEEKAAKSALINSYCTEGNHEFDCCCHAHEEGYLEGYKEASRSPTPEAVAVAFGEWLRKEGYQPMGMHWRKYYGGRKKGWHTTSDLFTMFTASTEYKQLFK